MTVSAANQAPVANAGLDASVSLPNALTLAGSVSDDGLPQPPGTVTVAWSQVSGPGTVTFGDAGSLTSTAAFSAAGSYTLRLTANDGALSGTDEVVVTVSAANIPVAPTMNPPTLLARTVTLSWSNVTDETGYEIGFANYNSRKRVCGQLAVLKAVGADVTTTTDTRNGGGVFCYAVRAFNAGGTSSWSNIVQVTVPKK